MSCNVAISVSSFADADPEPLNRLTEAGVSVVHNPYKRRLTKPEACFVFAE